VDGETGETSGSVYANREDAVRKAGRWLTPAISSITVPAHSARTISFAVAVPAGASAGQHLAGIAVQDRAQHEDKGSGFAIREVIRTVIGVLVEVPGHVAFEPTLSGAAIKKLEGPKVGAVLVRLGNAGGRLAKPTLSLTLRGPHGRVEHSDRQLDTILPGDSIEYPYTWKSELPRGHYEITATLRGAGRSVTRRFADELGQKLPGTNTPQVITDHTKSGFPLWAMILLAAGCLAAGAMVSRRRHPHSLAHR
jgi:hypothetical protein